MTGDKENWQALSHLLKHRWFSRVWVVQEVAVAANVRVVSGHVVLHWNELQEFSKYIGSNFVLFNALEMDDDDAYLGSKERESMRGVINGNRMVTCRRRYEMQEKVPLYHLLLDCQHFRCKDPRDRIYALLGLASDGAQEKIFPDYTKPIETVLEEAIRFMLQQEGGAVTMLLRAGVGYPKTCGVLPSWVPDLTIDRPTPFTIRAAQRYQAGTSHPPEMILLTDRPGCLAVKGVFINEVVEHLGPTFRLNELPAPPVPVRMTKDDPSLQYFQNWFRETTSLTQSHVQDPYFTGESLKEAIWRTFVGNTHAEMGDEPHIAPDHFREAFEAFKWLFGFGSEDGLPGISRLAQGLVSAEQLDEFTRRVASAMSLMGAFSGCMTGMRICVTAGGSLAVVPPDTQPGDLVTVIWGATAPYLLRHRPDVEPLAGAEHVPLYNLVGCCYLHGVMNGEIERDEDKDLLFFLV